MRLYRLLTGPDDSAFCRRVTSHLNRGWELHGNPSLSQGKKGTMVAQAVVREVDGKWDDETTNTSGY